MKRCFLAIRTPEFNEIHKKVDNISRDLDVKIKPVKPNLYHFTVHFFGDINENKIEDIKYHLNTIQFDPFNLTLKHTNILPPNRPNKTRILFVEPNEGKHQLMKTVKSVKSILRNAGFNIKRQKYIPHLTAARVKYGKDRTKLATRWRDIEFDLDPFEIKNIELIHSVLTPEGPIYNTIHSS